MANNSQPAILLNGVSKCFRTYSQPIDRLKEIIFPRLDKSQKFWALQSVNLSIKKGETIGILGKNGSGKSTLLQIIAKTLSPTTGEITVNGKVAALLELGSGFNPEFTGRQNVFFNGRLLGLSREEIEERFEEIADFADIGDFIERPVKTYSTGMSVRLAFAVATASIPDILIIDEALAVGDEAFQGKCFSRIKKIQNDGGTILFVSHSAKSIIELCDSAILIDSGELLLQSYPKMVVAEYQKLIYAPPDCLEKQKNSIRQLNTRLHESHKDKDKDRSFEKDQKLSRSNIKESEAREREVDSKNLQENINYSASFDPNLLSQSATSYITRGVTIQNPHITTISGEKVNILVPGERYIYHYSASFETDSHHIRFGMMIKNISGLEIGGAVSHTFENPINSIFEGEIFEVEFNFLCALQPGTYFLNSGVVGKVEETEVFLARELDVVIFKVQPVLESRATGVVDFGISPKIHRKVTAEI